MKSIYLILFSVFCTAGNIHSQCIDSGLICDTCACIALYDPVMGCDGEIYGNSCEAYNRGVTTWIPYLAPDFVSINAPSQINKGESATLLVEHNNVSPAVVSYEWDHGDTGKEIMVSPDSSTTYKVTVTAIYSFVYEDGSEYTYTDINTFDVYLEVRQQAHTENYSSENNKLKLFPNPANTILNINSVNSVTAVQITDIRGVVVKNPELRNNHTIIDVSDLKPGIYFAKILINDSILLRKVLIK